MPKTSPAMFCYLILITQASATIAVVADTVWQIYSAGYFENDFLIFPSKFDTISKSVTRGGRQGEVQVNGIINEGNDVVRI